MYHSIRSRFREKEFRFNTFFGFMRSVPLDHSEYPPVIKTCFDGDGIKKAHVMKIVRDPFLAEKCPAAVAHDEKPRRLMSVYARSLVLFHRHFYPAIWLLSHLRLGIYNSATEATDDFCRMVRGNQNLLCLPRSVFAATTSRRFRKEGAMFIGAFHPSRRMHAWVIEGTTNAYRHDYYWTNYTPLCIMT